MTTHNCSITNHTHSSLPETQLYAPIQSPPLPTFIPSSITPPTSIPPRAPKAERTSVRRSEDTERQMMMNSEIQADMDPDSTAIAPPDNDELVMSVTDELNIEEGTEDLSDDVNPFDGIPDEMISIILSFICKDVYELHRYGLTDKRWRGCTAIPLAHENVDLPVGIMKRLGSEEELLEFTRKGETFMPGLGRLKLPHSDKLHVTNRVLRVIASSFKMLKDLCVYNVKGITDFTPLRSLESLQELNLHSTNITNADLKNYVARLVNLEILDLQNTPQLNDEGISHLSSLTRLTYLDLFKTGVTDGGLKSLESLVNLEYLSLIDCTKITDAGLKHLVNLTRLRDLSLFETRVTDDGLANLNHLVSLRFLDVSNTGITDAGLLHISSLTGLTELELSGTDITDEGVVHILKLSSLNILDVTYTQISFEGVERLESNLTELETFHHDYDGEEEDEDGFIFRRQG